MVTTLYIALRIIDAFQIALQEAATGNADAIGQFVLVAVVTILGAQILNLANPAR